MNAVLRLGNNVLNLIDSHVAGITCFETTAGSKSHIVDCEYDRTEKRQIVFIERTIDKYVFIKARRDSIDRCCWHVEEVVSYRYRSEPISAWTSVLGPWNYSSGPARQR